MGGDSYCSSHSSTDDVPLSTQDFLRESSVSSEDEEGLSHKLANDSTEDFRTTSSTAEKQKSKVYTQVLRSYQNLQPRIDQLEEAKTKILSYTRGSWSPYGVREGDTPDVTSLLLIGPKGSGRSSLVNRISRVFEHDLFLPARAQVSSSSSPGDGTYFLYEYMMPRGSGSFCLYDTRGLSPDSSENVKMVEHWMTRGVHHGEMITRNSDSISLKAQLKCKARRSFRSSRKRGIDFVIFVVNGLTVLEAMNKADETKKGYSEMIATNFNNSLLSFKDDKPVVVVTHGDLLPLCDRARVRTYLGDLLGVPPTQQIFDIPDDNDPATTSATFEMLIYCLDRADRNLPAKRFSLWMIAAMVFAAVLWIGGGYFAGVSLLRYMCPLLLIIWSSFYITS